MSILMHCYRIKKTDWWDFFDEVCNYYINDSLTMGLAIAYQKEESGHDFWKFCQNNENHISIQLFDFGDNWIFRVLESGYCFANKHKELFPELGEVFYDDRSDIPLEDEANEAIADKIDMLLRQRKYFIASIIDSDLLFSIPFDIDRIKEELASEK